jgi:hypothetical protein
VEEIFAAPYSEVAEVHVPAVAAATESQYSAREREADARIRTGDPFITSEVLYQLSYVGETASDGSGGSWPVAARHRGEDALDIRADQKRWPAADSPVAC